MLRGEGNQAQMDGDVIKHHEGDVVIDLEADASRAAHGQGPAKVQKKVTPEDEEVLVELDIFKIQQSSRGRPKVSGRMALW